MGYKVVITDAQFPTQDPERRTLGDIADLMVDPGTRPEVLIEIGRAHV
jgi:hypothetical protein